MAYLASPPQYYQGVYYPNTFRVKNKEYEKRERKKKNNTIKEYFTPILLGLKIRNMKK